MQQAETLLILPSTISTPGIFHDLTSSAETRLWEVGNRLRKLNVMLGFLISSPDFDGDTLDMLGLVHDVVDSCRALTEGGTLQ